LNFVDRDAKTRNQPSHYWTNEVTVMGDRGSALGVALSLLMTIAPARTVHSGETLEELQRRFDNESDGVNKAKMLQKLGDAQFLREREGR